MKEMIIEMLASFAVSGALAFVMSFTKKKCREYIKNKNNSAPPDGEP